MKHKDSFPENKRYCCYQFKYYLKFLLAVQAEILFLSCVNHNPSTSVLLLAEVSANLFEKLVCRFYTSILWAAAVKGQVICSGEQWNLWQ